MNAQITAALCSALAGVLAGCSTPHDVPLLFGTSNVVGISMGGSVAGSGAEFTLGYKGHDFAVVPVTAHQPGGSELKVGSEQPGVSDAYSVLGQFGASGTRTSDQANTALGKFFATGMAARTLAGGFAQKLSGTGTLNKCGAARSETSTASATPAPSPGKPAARPQPSNAEQTAPQKGQMPPRDPAAEGMEGGKLLLFAQYASLGFATSSSAAESGFDLTLGWKDRNMAIVPVTIRDGAGNAEALRSRNGGFYDSYSVLGQFNFESSQGSALSEVGLGKFFSTGGAAVRLGEGFAVRLCDEHTPVKATQ
jgi:hypothetical protein